MKLTEISNYDARPGALSEWRLHPATLAAAAASPEDERPPSFIQDAHVRTAAALRQIGVDAPTWLATAFDFHGALDVAAMEATLLHWIARHETLRSGLRLEGHELKRFTLSAEAVSLDRVVVDEFTCGAAMVGYLEDRFDEAADPLTWPPYIFATVDHEDGFTVYLAFDHSNVDGYSIAALAHEIHELYDAALADRPAELPAVGSYVDFSQLERDAAADLDSTHESVGRWQDFIDASGGELPRFPLDLGVAPGEMPRQTSGCEWLIDDADAKAFDDACRAAGGNFAAGVLATASAVAYELGDNPVYRTVMPLHTRSEPRWAASLGWYIGLAPLEIPTAEAADFPELVRMARAASRAVKSMAQVPFAKVGSLLADPVRPLSVISYIDTRVVPGAPKWDEWNAQAFGKVSYGDEVYMWINRTPDGAYVTVRYPSTDVAHRNVKEYIERVREVLTTVARTGTYPFTGALIPAHDGACSPHDVGEAPGCELRREPLAHVGGWAEPQRVRDHAHAHAVAVADERGEGLVPDWEAEHRHVGRTMRPKLQHALGHRTDVGCAAVELLRRTGGELEGERLG
jgi:hypothetical protein